MHIHTHTHMHTILFSCVLFLCVLFTAAGRSQSCDICSGGAFNCGFVSALPLAVQERGICYGFEGEKKYVCWFRSYLLIASMESQVQRRATTISVYDLKNRFIAFSLPLPGMTGGPPVRSGRGMAGAAGGTRVFLLWLHSVLLTWFQHRLKILNSLCRVNV